MSVWWRTFDANVGETLLHWITMGATINFGDHTLSDGSYIMQYFTREDLDSPGNFQTWTCTVQYNEASQLAYATIDEVIIKNFYGEHKFTADAS